ncbi:MAG: hypothetical protein KDC48_04815, partial [Planctomycetes bacterium]|nr:hypothetical protein [Planctomycetota bacterium]
PVPEALETIQAALIAERPARTWPGSGEPVEQLEFCGGDRFLIAVTADGKAQQFEVAKHDAPRAIPHDGRVGAIAVSAAGDGLVVLGDAVDGHLTAWRPGTLEKVWSAPAWREAQPVRELRFDARGDEVLCVGDRSVVVFSAEGAPRGAIACAGKPTAVTWCNADRIAIAEQRLDAPGTADSRIAVYEHDGDAWAEVAQLPDQPCVIALDTDPSEARRLLVVCAGLTERLANDQGVMEERPRAGIWDIASGWRPCGITAKGELLAGAFSSNGDRILLISRGGVVMPFRGDGSSMPNTWALDAAFAARTDPTRTCLGIMDDVGMLTLHTFDGVATRSLGRRRLRDRAQAFSIDGTLVAASTWQHELLVYRLYDPELPTIHLGENVRAALWAPGGSDVLTANTNMSGGFFGDVARWNLATGRQRAPSLGRLPHRVFEAVPSPSGQRLLCLVSYGKLQQGAMVWRVGPEGLSDKREMRVGCIDGYAMRGAMPNDNTALIADGSGAVLVWQLDSDTPTRLEVPGANARGANARWVTVEADPDLSTVWVGTAGGELHRFRRGADGMHAFTGTRIFPGNIGDLKLLEDGSLMIAGGLGLVARLFPDGHVQHFDAHTWNVRSVDATFLDGERVIATGDNEGWIQLWRDDGTPLRRIPAHQGIVHTLHFSADGSRLLSASADGTARVWIVREADLLELAKRRAGG